MSDRPNNTTGSDAPLFQNMDEQEQTYASDQAPGAADGAYRDAVVGSADDTITPPVYPTASAPINAPVPPFAAPNAQNPDQADFLVEGDRE